MISCIIALVVGALVLTCDQLVKSYIVANFTLGGEGRTVIDGILNFTYVENKGGAWGMMNTRPWLLLCLASIIAVICIMMLIKYKSKSKLLFWALSLILFGGIGNIADRIFRSAHAVVDFIQVTFIDFPVFNIADCAVCIGAGLFVLFFIVDTVKSGKNKKAVDLLSDNNAK